MTHRFSQGILDQKAAGLLPVIPDIKRFSPGEGTLLGARRAEDYAACLLEAGARVVSVVTEKKRYGGSPDMLTRVASLGLPVLRKDFLTTRDGIHDSLSMGASAVLLIASLYNDERELAALYDYALALGLEPLVETHNAAELCMAERLRAGLIGINNRDISVFEQDGGTVSTTEALCRLTPENAIVISESGIQTPQDVYRAVCAGADAALVGTALLRDPAALYRALTNQTFPATPIL